MSRRGWLKRHVGPWGTKRRSLRRVFGVIASLMFVGWGCSTQNGSQSPNSCSDLGTCCNPSLPDDDGFATSFEASECLDTVASEDVELCSLVLNALQSSE